ncbi:hypothetical protein [Comamonas antarctica]|uniref:hypothetical protein n=1 Tax=Comamonas antarctica TaxID=2743470 RepID=UPI0028E18CE0|nr:hypothetical protein [Comamonas antarctica]
MIEWNSTRYADPLELARGQGDPLDLASTNERLYNTVFFGFNNVVRYIRVYSAMCWMAREVEIFLNKTKGLTKAQARDQRTRAMEKIELAVLWASGPDAELSGKTRSFAKDGESQRLTMDQWDMSARLLSAQQYQPSLTNGFKFVKVGLVCTDRGRQLASAFEARLGAPQAHQWLRDVTCLEATSVQIERARGILSVLEPPTAMERQAFTASFFPDDPRDTGEISDSRDEQRWLSLHLVLNTIAQLDQAWDAQDEDGIRAAMTSGMTPSARSVIRPGLERSQALWATLQLRLLQRIALETLLAFVIGWVQLHNRAGRRAADCARDIGDAAGQAFLAVGLEKVKDLRAVLANAQHGQATLALVATTTGNQASDVFYYLRELDKLKSAAWHGGQGEWLRLAVTGLAVCAVEAGNFMRLPWHQKALDSIVGERTSLTALLASFQCFNDRPLAEWTQELVMAWSFSRYSEVAAHRAVLQNGKLRFDFSEGEFGLELGPPRNAPFQPVWQGDKLYTALVLLQQCGMLEFVDEKWSLTMAGKKRVRDYAPI